MLFVAVSSDFFKSMTTDQDKKVWQDVYYGATPSDHSVYIKITGYTDGRPPVISFKAKLGGTMQCPACSYPEMEEKSQDETISYRGQSVTVENLRGEFCPACGEGVWDSESNRCLDEAQMALMNTVRTEASADIRRIRKSLKLTQAELAKNFGLGPLAFSRYERGKTQPPILLVKVLRLLEKHPDLLEELREMSEPHRDSPTAACNVSCRRLP